MVPNPADKWTPPISRQKQRASPRDGKRPFVGCGTPLVKSVEVAGQFVNCAFISIRLCAQIRLSHHPERLRMSSRSVVHGGDGLPSALSPVAGLPSQSERIFHRLFPGGATIPSTNHSDERISKLELAGRVSPVSSYHFLPSQKELCMLLFDYKVGETHLSNSKGRIKPQAEMI